MEREDKLLAKTDAVVGDGDCSIVATITKLVGFLFPTVLPDRSFNHLGEMPRKCEHHAKTALGHFWLYLKGCFIRMTPNVRRAIVRQGQHKTQIGSSNNNNIAGQKQVLFMTFMADRNLATGKTLVFANCCRFDVGSAAVLRVLLRFWLLVAY